jgi:stress response protein YsnF
MRQHDGDSETASVPLAEETVSVERREVLNGKVRVRTDVDILETLVAVDLRVGRSVAS